MKKRLVKKSWCFSIILLLVGTSVVSALGTLVVEEKYLLENGTNPLNFEGNIIYVDDNFTESTPGWNVTHFDKIQNGIGNASEGDMVYVYNGTYEETIDVDRRIFLIGQDGHNEGTKIIWDEETDYMILISVNGAEVKNFYLEGVDGETEMGIKLDEECIHVAWNKIVNCDYGIFIDEGDEGSENQIRFNIIDNCGKVGIHLTLKSNGNLIFGNTVKNISWKDGAGIHLDQSGYNTVLHNILINCHAGVKIKHADSDYNVVGFNNFTDCTIGIHLYQVGYLNLIRGNDFHGSEDRWGVVEISNPFFGRFNFWFWNYCDDGVYHFVPGTLVKHWWPRDFERPFNLPY